MKTASIFPYLLLVFAIFFLSSCSAYQLAQWSQGGSSTTSSGVGGHHQANYCPHYSSSPNYKGGMARGGVFSMRGEYYPFCHKCRQ
jgi:hypothetical protein